ncbi:hypothetical protein TWF718_001047 [Orbilia javanica]|uniref:Uncharacterized protein n=1 Tax=Orbilia javanica TaxID=47235 RepID=A0AAN8N941_9PEZI
MAPRDKSESYVPFDSGTGPSPPPVRHVGCWLLRRAYRIMSLETLTTPEAPDNFYRTIQMSGINHLNRAVAQGAYHSFALPSL